MRLQGSCLVINDCMQSNLTVRKATINDLPRIIELFLEDDLGKTRENKSFELNQRYISAFNKIASDSNQHLMVIKA